MRKTKAKGVTNKDSWRLIKGLVRFLNGICSDPRLSRVNLWQKNDSAKQASAAVAQINYLAANQNSLIRSDGMCSDPRLSALICGKK
jgi:hypothetical protein